MGVTNFLFHAADEAIYQRLLDLGAPVVYYESDPAREFRLANTPGAHAVDYGTVAYQALMNTRTTLIYKILQKGYNVLLSDVDIVYLRNPFQYLNTSLDLQGGAHKGNKVTGGFLYLRATAATKALWARIVSRHRDMFKQIQTLSDFNPHSMTEQELLNQNLLSSKAEELSWGLVDERVLADGKRFFLDQARLALSSPSRPRAALLLSDRGRPRCALC